MTIRVLVVDDHPVVRSGLRLLIDGQADMEVVGEAGTIAAALEHPCTAEPDVVLLDVGLPERSGVEGLPDLRAAYEGAKVLILSMDDNPTYVREALAAGAGGYVLKEAVGTEVVHALREVAAGKRYVQPELGARLIDATSPPAVLPATDSLSPREREILPLLALGHTNQEIGVRLDISVRTVEAHRASIMQKLRLGTRAEIVRYAIEHGLFSAEPVGDS